MFYDKDYDIIIVGAGPGGSVCAWEAAKAGLSVLLLERDREAGTPVRCAEGVGVAGLLEFFPEGHPLVTRWEKNYGIRFIAPDNTILDLHHESRAAILDRKDFDYELSRLAALEGATVVTMANVTGLVIEDNFIRGVEVIFAGKKYNIKSKIVVGADGIESRVGRWAGIDTTPDVADLEACAQYTLSNIDIDENRLDFYFGKDVAPRGYVWVFPKGNRTANVGLGVAGNYSKDKKAIEYLDNFVKNKFPEASIVSTTCGGVVCSDTLEKIYGNGLLLVGDAAHMTNAVTGGGIINAMKAGKIAAQVCKESVDASDYSEKFLKRYQKLWDKKQGKMNHKFFKLSKSIENITDETLNKTAKKLNSKPFEKRTIISVFKSVLINQPKLILDLPAMFA